MRRKGHFELQSPQHPGCDSAVDIPVRLLGLFQLCLFPPKACVSQNAQDAQCWCSKVIIQYSGLSLFVPFSRILNLRVFQFLFISGVSKCSEGMKGSAFAYPKCGKEITQEF